jgi:hypothetical protein
MSGNLSRLIYHIQDMHTLTAERGTRPEERKLEAKTRRWFRSCGPEHIALIVSTTCPFQITGNAL